MKIGYAARIKLIFINGQNWYHAASIRKGLTVMVNGQTETRSAAKNDIKRKHSEKSRTSIWVMVLKLDFFFRIFMVV